MNIGILGAGQLGRMLTLAGYPQGHRFRVFDPTPDSPAGEMAAQFVGRYEDLGALAHFAEGLDVVTYEFENVPVEAARFLSQHVAVFPPPKALEAAQDRMAEKSLFERLAIPVPPFAFVETEGDLNRGVERMGLPAVLKTCRFGYDGKGQTVLREEKDLLPAWEAMSGRPLILEGFVPFEREVSLLAVRSRTGEVAYYPLVENHHREGILRLSIAPAPDLTPALQAEAERYASRLLEALDYVGVLAIEFFVKDGHLLANEMAPRVHNSGHWTIEGAETSQFENHLRAVLGLPLGSTAVRGHAAMVNLIGSLPSVEEVLRLPGAYLHLYGKEPRPGRKIGHINLCTATTEARETLLAKIQTLVKDSHE